jgi:hypothetical protein
MAAANNLHLGVTQASSLHLQFPSEISEGETFADNEPALLRVCYLKTMVLESIPVCLEVSRPGVADRHVTHQHTQTFDEFGEVMRAAGYAGRVAILAAYSLKISKHWPTSNWFRRRTTIQLLSRST